MKVSCFARVGLCLALFTGASPPQDDDPPPAGKKDPEVTVLEGVEMRVHLAPPDVEKLEGKLLAAFDVSAGGHFLLGVEGKEGGRNLIVPEAGLRLLSADDPLLETFCRLPGGALIAIRNGHLARLDGERLVEEVGLPGKGMGLAPASTNDRFFLFGGEGPTARLVFEVLEGRKYRKLVEAPGAVGAVAEVGDTLYLAVGTQVVGVPRDSPATTPYEAPPKTPAISSLASDPEARILYIATPDGVTALRRGKALGILAGCGGEIRFRNGSLFVLDPRRDLLVELKEVSKLLLDGRDG